MTPYVHEVVRGSHWLVGLAGLEDEHGLQRPSSDHRLLRRAEGRAGPGDRSLQQRPCGRLKAAHPPGVAAGTDYPHFLPKRPSVPLSPRRTVVAKLAIVEHLIT